MTLRSDLIARLEALDNTWDAAWCQKCGFLEAGAKIFISRDPRCTATRKTGTVKQAIAALKAREVAR